MSPRYRDASALFSGVFTAVLLSAMRAMPLRARPRHLRLAGALVLALWLLLALLGAAAPTQAAPIGRGNDPFQPARVIVQLRPASDVAIEKINAAHGSTTLDRLPGEKGAYLLKLPPGSDPEVAVDQIAADPRVLYAEPNFLAKAPEGYGEDKNYANDNRHEAFGISPTDGSSEQYAASALDLPCAAALSLGEGSTVAVIDTGVQLDHPRLEDDFEGVARYDFVDKDKNPTERPVGLDADGDGLEDEMVGHGTHVAGIVDLVAPSAKIMPLRVLDTEGIGTSFTIAKAIVYAEDNGANVINLSLGSSSRSRLLQEVIEDAIKNGVVVAAAAGNSNSALPHYPAAGDGTAASVDGLLAVTSVNMYQKRSDFANYGIWVDIAAPGEGVRSTFPVSVYANWSGTSMATPFISGQAALIRTLYGSLSPAGIEKKIQTSAQPLTLQNPTYVGMLGAGEANVCASLLQST